MQKTVEIAKKHLTDLKSKIEQLGVEKASLYMMEQIYDPNRHKEFLEAIQKDLDERERILDLEVGNIKERLDGLPDESAAFAVYAHYFQSVPLQILATMFGTDIAQLLDRIDAVLESVGKMIFVNENKA